MGSPKPNFFDAWIKNLTAGPVLTPDLEYTGPHGMPSGSVATNLFDSLHNAFAIEGYLLTYGIEGAKYFVQGDDAVIIGNGVDPEDFAKFVKDDYGFIAHPDKQFFSSSGGAADYLRMSYYPENDFRPTYPVSRIAWRAIGHERFSFQPSQWNEWAVVVRATQQLENGIDNPSIKALIAWLMKGDKLRLGYDKSPQEILESAGKAGDVMIRERARWDPGAAQNDWNQWPIHRLIDEVGRVMR